MRIKTTLNQVSENNDLSTNVNVPISLKLVGTKLSNPF